MINEQIRQYVATERARGVTEEALRAELLRTGWATKDIEAVLVPNASQSETQSVTPSNLGFFRKLAWGRIGRLRYFLGSLFGFAISIIPIFLLVALWGVIGYFQSTGSLQESGSPIYSILNVVIPILLALALLAPYLLVHIMLAIRRLHDLNMSGWLILVMYIPFIGPLFSLYVLFAPGSAGSNGYGILPDTKRKFIADIFNRNPS